MYGYTVCSEFLFLFHIVDCVETVETGKFWLAVDLSITCCSDYSRGTFLFLFPVVQQAFRCATRLGWPTNNSPAKVLSRTKSGKSHLLLLNRINSTTVVRQWTCLLVTHGSGSKTCSITVHWSHPISSPVCVASYFSYITSPAFDQIIRQAADDDDVHVDR